MRKYLYKISGADMEIIPDTEADREHEIVIGKTNRCSCDISELGDDGFIIKTEGEKLFIEGSAVRGALYGVYSFLEKLCNCRFYTDTFERIPRSESVTVPDGYYVREVPVFEYRNTYWYAQSGEFISAKLKNNGGMGHEITERVGGAVNYSGAFCHTLGYLSGMCRRDELAWDQPCLSDERVYETVLANVKEELRENPDCKIISVSQLDGNNGECSCERCRAVYEEEHSHMGTLLRFVNRIQRDIKSEFHDVRIDTLAYRFTRVAPDVTKPDPDLIIRLCNIECGFRHPLSMGGIAPAFGDEVNFARNLKKWSEITNHLYIWDYTTNFTNFSIPFVNFGALRENVRFFVENGITGVFEQGNIAALNGEFGELRGYLLCKLLWNPYMTEDEYRGHMKDFLYDYYGDGGEAMLEYIDYELACSVQSNFGVYYDDASHYVYVDGLEDKLAGGFEFYKNASAMFDRAEALTADDPVCNKNVRRSRIQLYSYRFFILTKKMDAALDEGEKKALLDEIIASNKIQFSLMKECDVTSNREFNTVSFDKEPDYTKSGLLW